MSHMMRALCRDCNCEFEYYPDEKPSCPNCRSTNLIYLAGNLPEKKKNSTMKFGDRETIRIKFEDKERFKKIIKY